MNRILLILTLALLIIGCGDSEDKLIEENNSATDNITEKIDTTPYDNMSSEEKNLALIEASKNGDLEKIKGLIASGAQINYRYEDLEGDIFDDTALMRASSEGHIEVVKYLIENGADVNNHADGGRPLMSASSGGHLEIVKLLVENGADINAKGQSYNSALIEATYKNYIEIIKLLIDAGADVNISNEYGITALMSASEVGI